MKKPVTIAIAVLIILQVMTLSRINDLQNELQRTKNQIANLSSEQSGRISSIYSRIDSLLKTQASLVDRAEVVFGQVDSDRLMVPVTFKITPKELKTGTQAVLEVSGASTPMTRSGTTFMATVPAGLFTPLQATVMLNDGDVQRSERLDVRDDLRQQLLPFVVASFMGDRGYTRKPGSPGGEFRLSGPLRFDVKPVVGNTITAARLVIEIDGRTIREEPVNTGGGIETNLDERIALAAGQKLIVSVRATDQLGLTYQSTIDQFSLDANGNPVNLDEWSGPEAIIIDKAGKVVWSPRA